MVYNILVKQIKAKCLREYEMKIKELFKKIENANEVAKIFNEKYVLQFTPNTVIFPAEFSKYDEFVEFVKDEYRETWANPLLADFYVSTISTKENEFVAVLFEDVDPFDEKNCFSVHFKIVKYYY